MLYVPQLPCYKIYKQSNHALRIICFENETHMWHFKQDCVGDFLIEFLEMDLTAYKNVLKEFIKDDAFNFRLQFEFGYRGTCNKLRDAADLLSDNSHLLRFLIAKMESCFDKEEWSDPEQLQNAYVALCDVATLQQEFETGIAFCMDDSQRPEFSAARKFAAFIEASSRLKSYTFQTGYAMVPVDKSGHLDYDTVRRVNDNNMSLDEQLDTIHEGKDGVSLLPFTWIFSFEDLIFYDFLELASRGLRVKRCKLCDKFFVQKTHHKTEYCDRKTENGRTCKQVGPKKIFNEELQKPENVVLKEYDRVRKMKQQKLERDRNKETGADVGKAQAIYDKWSVMAAELREQFIKCEISDEELLAKVNL